MIILGSDWISSHDLRFLYPAGADAGASSSGPLTAPLQPTPPAGSAQAQTLALIGHGEFRRMLQQGFRQ